MKWYSPTPLPLAAVFAFAACSGAIAEKSPPAQDGGVVSPSSGLDVHAAVASATLGDEGCAGPAGARLSGSSGICAAPMSQDASLTTVPCDVGCRPSTIQIQFTAGGFDTTQGFNCADSFCEFDAFGDQLFTGSAPFITLTAGTISPVDFDQQAAQGGADGSLGTGTTTSFTGPTATPEPATLSLLALGALGVLAKARKK